MTNTYYSHYISSFPNFDFDLLLKPVIESKKPILFKISFIVECRGIYTTLDSIDLEVVSDRTLRTRKTDLFGTTNESAFEKLKREHEKLKEEYEILYYEWLWLHCLFNPEQNRGQHQTKLKEENIKVNFLRYVDNKWVSPEPKSSKILIGNNKQYNYFEVGDEVKIEFYNFHHFDICFSLFMHSQKSHNFIRVFTSKTQFYEIRAFEKPLDSKLLLNEVPCVKCNLNQCNISSSIAFGEAEVIAYEFIIWDKNCNKSFVKFTRNIHVYHNRKNIDAIKKLGFDDEELIFSVLKESNDNINIAVDKLVESTPSN